jgi:hypothetical protein
MLIGEDRFRRFFVFDPVDDCFVCGLVTAVDKLRHVRLMALWRLKPLLSFLSWIANRLR